MTKISILIGQLKVIEVFENVAITRITNLVSSGKTPVVQFRSVMTGDYAVPVRQEIAAGKIRAIPKLSAEPLKPVSNSRLLPPNSTV